MITVGLKMCVSPDRQAVFREAVALGEEADRARAAGHRVTLLLRNPRLAAHEEAVLVGGNVIEPEQAGCVWATSALPGSDSCSCRR